MTDRPILFSGPMVRALLDGRKTQTRRIAKPRRKVSLLDGQDPKDFRLMDQWTDGCILDPGNAEWLAQDAPARAGETMYVREAWRTLQKWDDLAPRHLADDRSKITYEADPENRNPLWAFGKLRPGIHMPRWASRIERTIIGCRLERLNDCSEADTLAEGLISWTYLDCDGDPRLDGVQFEATGFDWKEATDPLGGHDTAVSAYRALWEHINGPGSWDANPLVWVIEFEAGA